MLAPEQMIQPPRRVENGVLYEEDWRYPDQMPDCMGARGGSTKECGLWVRRQRW
jgi:hypothetical protein